MGGPEDEGSDVPGIGTISTVPPPPVDASGELARGAILDRYVILRRLGRGGMGVVYLALDSELERRVAIKVLRPETMAGASAGETRSRLLREAQAMAKVSHPNVVAIYDVGTFGDEVFLAMEHVPGKTLREWRHAAERTAREIVGAYVQAGRGLEAAHAAGLLHRDFKPENVLVDDAGRVRVLDFGLARLESSGAPPGTASLGLDDTGVHSRDALGAPLTAAGEILGTPAYMAPEQLVGAAITARSDQFSFCLALYEALYRELPFGGDTVAQRAAYITKGRLKPVPRDARVSNRVRRVLLRGLSAADEARFASMSALLAELERASSSPKWWGVSIGATGVALALAAIAVARPAAKTSPCLGAAQAILPAWSPSRAETVERAFAASGNPRAAEAFAHTKAVLDRYAASWVAMSTDACLATRVRGVQSDEGLDLRSACLHHREGELQATVDLLSRPDPTIIDDAALAAARLTPIDTCVDVAALRVSFLPPRDEAQRRAIEEMRPRLAELGALCRAGKYDEAYPVAIALVDRATRIDYGPTRAEALFWRARAEFGLDKSEAPATFVDAALEAEGARDDLLAADSWIRAFGIASERGESQDAERDGRFAEAAVRRLRGGDARLRVQLLRGKSFDANLRGVPAEGLALAREALSLAEKTSEPSDLGVVLARSAVADALFGEGDIEGALSIYEVVHRGEMSLLGESHANTYRSLDDIGDCLVELGDYAAAIKTLEPMRTATLARKPNGVTYGRLLLSAAIIGSGRVAEGTELFDATEAIVRERGDEQGALSDTVQIARSLALREANREAEALVNRAFASFAKGGELEGDRQEAYGVRALCKVRRGDAAGALVDADLALAKSETMTARKRLIPLLARGEALLALRREVEGLAELERALAIANDTRGDLGIRADTRFAAARALSATHGDPARATALATRAADELDRAGLPDAATKVRATLRR